MEQHSLSLFAAAVEPVADDGGAEAEPVGGMDPELVGASGDRGEFDPGPLTWIKGEIELALERAAEAFARYAADRQRDVA